MAKKIQALGMGGTFDHFHAGHEKFITFAYEQAEQLFIGVTTEKMSRGKKYAHLIEPYPERLQAVKAFCHRHHIRAKVSHLEDEYGPTLEGAQVQALCVTRETASGADKINAVRAQLGMYKLPVFVSDYELDDNGQPIHSEFIRAGRVSRTGRVYQNLFESDLVLPAAAREFFTQPQGPVSPALKLSRPQHQTPTDVIAVVGDSSLEQFLTNHWPYQLGIYDHRQQRQAYSSEALANISPNFTVDNPPGIIAKSLATTLLSQLLPTTATAKPVHIQVNGEEDLASVALIMMLPLESEVYYGQPNAGIVRMKITEELKETTWKLLSATTE